MKPSTQYGRLRFYEILPGALVWATILLAFILSIFWPIAAIIAIIVFDLYWTFRVVYFLIHVMFSYRKYKQVSAVNWTKELKKIDGWKDVHHVILLPTYKEDESIVRKTLESIRIGAYDASKFTVVLGGEEKDSERFLKAAETLKSEFGQYFRDFLITVHPFGIEGEMPGKGSNLKWMEGCTKEYLDEQNIDGDNVLVSAFDVDTVPHPQYFARIAQLFLTIEDPHRTSYQPLTLFSNNIWNASVPVRVTSFGTTFWLLSELVRPERMWTFSSHSMTWRMLEDVGYHEPNLVSEDSRIFMQGFLRYNGDYRVTPVMLPVHMDAVEADSFTGSLKALYKQQRRWAWGVEHLPYMVAEFRKRPLLPLRLKIKFLFNHMEGMYTWATAPILIFVLGYLPFFFASDVTSSLVTNSPFTLERMMQIATIGVFATGIMSFLFLPPKPERHSKWSWLVMIVQWALLPVTFVLFGAFPSIDAQTRLMLGKYLGFNVTEKKKR
jgi:hypothetical protein